MTPKQDQYIDELIIAILGDVEEATEEVLYDMVTDPEIQIKYMGQTFECTME